MDFIVGRLFGPFEATVLALNNAIRAVFLNLVGRLQFFELSFEEVRDIENSGKYLQLESNFSKSYLSLIRFRSKSMTEEINSFCHWHARADRLARKIVGDESTESPYWLMALFSAKVMHAAALMFRVCARCRLKDFPLCVMILIAPASYTTHRVWFCKLCVEGLVKNSNFLSKIS